MMCPKNHSVPRKESHDYLTAVQNRFKEDNGKYLHFIQLLLDFRLKRIDVAGLQAKVKELFKGHKDLITGLNVLLPKNYEITLPLENEQPSQNLSGDDSRAGIVEGLEYIIKIRKTFQEDSETYKAFIELLNEIRVERCFGRINKAVVAARVKKLFKGHNGLILGFNVLLPKNFEITLPLENEQPSQNMSGDDRCVLEALEYINTVKNTFHEDSEKYKAFIELLIELRAKRCFCRINKAVVAARVTKLFKEHRDLILRFNVLLPKEYEITLPRENVQPQNSSVKDAAAEYLAHMIKNQFGIEHLVFSDTLKLYEDGKMSATEFQHKIAPLLLDQLVLLDKIKTNLADTPQIHGSSFAVPTTQN